MAHAFQGYQGACKNVHDHSYKLPVTVLGSAIKDKYVPTPGFIFDFKELKQLVNESIVSKVDVSFLFHRIILARIPPSVLGKTWL